MATQHLLYRDSVLVGDTIEIAIPTVGQILDCEDDYYSLVSVITSMPIDFMVQLDDMGIDYTEVTAYDVFLAFFPVLQMSQHADLVFKNIDITNFRPAINEDSKQIVMIDPVNDIKIDRIMYERMATALRKIHHLEKNRRKPAGEEAKKYLLERARKKLKRRRNRENDSQLEQLIIAMVNNNEYKYDFEGTKELSIYQFNESVRQVIKKVDYNNRMIGIYTGSIDTKKLSQSDLTWLSTKGAS